MPKRFLDDSICKSQKMNSLSNAAEVLFYRLIVNADDYGRYYGDPEIVERACFGKRKPEAIDVESCLHELARVGLLQLYESDGEMYLQLTGWAEHQSIRAQKSKFPSPVKTTASNCMQMHADESNGKQMQTNAPVFVCECESVCETAATGAPAREDGEGTDSAPDEAVTQETQAITGHQSPQQKVRCYDYYQRKMTGGIGFNLIDRDTLAYFLNEGMEDGLVCAAIDECSTEGVRKLSYLRGILASCLDEGCLKLEDFNRRREEFKASRARASPPGRKGKNVGKEGGSGGGVQFAAPDDELRQKYGI